MKGLRNIGLRRRLILPITLVIIVSIAVGVVSIGSMLLFRYDLESLYRQGVLVQRANDISSTDFIITIAVIAAVLLLGIIISLVLTRRIARSVCAPVEKLIFVVEQVSSTGDFAFTEEFKKSVRDDGKNFDEIGRFSRSFAKMMDDILAKITVLDQAAYGDLTPRAPSASESDTLGNATNKLIGNMNEMTRSIHVSVDNLSAGIAQVSQGAQALAQSTIEQSATVEALKATISELSQKSSSNAMHSQEASDIVSEILRSAEEGRASMNKMTESMEEINAASQSISAVIKAIDDIAFQTNILSLNAAVEAARAGQHGRGFAVVADEVRNLATKSAEAAMDTNDLIADTISKSGAGFDIVRGASDYLNDIVTGVSESTYRLKSIAIATMEQNESLETINEGFVQLSDVVQQNSSTAEESAAATEQMMSQVESLRSFVSGFKIDDGLAGMAIPVPETTVTAGAYGAAPANNPAVNNPVAVHPAASSAWKDDESKY